MAYCSSSVYVAFVFGVSEVYTRKGDVLGVRALRSLAADGGVGRGSTVSREPGPRAGLGFVEPNRGGSASEVREVLLSMGKLCVRGMDRFFSANSSSIVFNVARCDGGGNRSSTSPYDNQVVSLWT